MQSVFVSYAHEDAPFTDRLVRDLRLSEVEATYDKWLLRVGDSLIEKISSAVVAATNVIAVLSPSSVGSRWVTKELSMAMTGEVNGREVRVLPALVADCELPPMLADKLYADFRLSYYAGLRQLLRALNHTEHEYHFGKQEEIEKERAAFSKRLELGSAEVLRVWFLTHGHYLAMLLGRPWAVSEAIPEFSLEAAGECVDFLVVNGQSFRYEISLVHIGPTSVGEGRNRILETARSLHRLVSVYRSDESRLRAAVATRLESRYGASQISGRERHDFLRGLKLDAKMLCGRRHDFDGDGNQLREEVVTVTQDTVEMVSYDRLLEAMDIRLKNR